MQITIQIGNKNTYTIEEKDELTPERICKLLSTNKQARAHFGYDEATNVLHSKGTEESRCLTELMKQLGFDNASYFLVTDDTNDTVWMHIGENLNWSNSYWAILSAKLHLDTTGKAVSRLIGGYPDHKLTRQELDEILAAKNNCMLNNDKAMLFDELFH